MRRRLRAQTSRRLGAVRRSLGGGDEEASESESEEADEAAAEGDEAKAGASGCRRRLFDFGLSVNQAEAKNLAIKIGRAGDRGRSHQRTVEFTLRDPDAADVFAVRIRQDKVFGTPIFETVGGVSQCPGESGTTKKDSFVTIASENAPPLQYYCGAPFCKNIPYGKTAYIGLIIQNTSPVQDQRFPYRDTAKYRLFTTTTVSEFRDGQNFCGTPGYSRGLSIRRVGDTVLLNEPGIEVNLPYGQTEIILEIDAAFGSPIECLSYEKIPLVLVADCEYRSPTYQYQTMLDPISKEPKVSHPTFNVDTADWDTTTLPHIPARATTDPEIYSADSVSVRYLDISWTEPGTPTAMPTSGSPTTKPTTTAPTPADQTLEPTTGPPSGVPSSVPTAMPSPTVDLKFGGAVDTDRSRPGCLVGG